MDTAAPQSGEKRPVGRPRGLPKTGGRPKGAKNRLPEEFRRFIDQRGRPLELLAAIARGNKVTAADPSDPTTKTRIYPSLAERTVAARALLDRLLPALKATELSGPGGGPVQVDGRELSDFEAARRIAFILASGLHAQRPASAAPAALSAPEKPGGAEPREGAASPSAAPPEPPAVPLGHEEVAGSYTLRLVDRFPDGRERWTAHDEKGLLATTGFGREAVLARLVKGDDE